MVDYFEKRNYVDNVDDVDSDLFEDLEERIEESFIRLVTGDPALQRRKVRGVYYVSKAGVTPNATFNPDEWELDKKMSKEIAVQGIRVFGHSWTDTGNTVPSANWVYLLTRMLRLDEAKGRLLAGTGGSTAYGRYRKTDGSDAEYTARPFQGMGAKIGTFTVDDRPTAEVPGLHAGAKPWINWAALSVIFLGYNDPYCWNQYTSATGWKAITKTALRFAYSSERTARRYHPQSNKITYGAGWQLFSEASLAPLSPHKIFAAANLTEPGQKIIQFNLPYDYDGRPIAIPYVLNNSMGNNWWAMEAYTEGANRSNGVYTTTDEQAQRGTIETPGVWRILGYTAADAGKTVSLVFTSLGGWISFGGVAFEGDNPIVVPMFPRQPVSLMNPGSQTIVETNTAESNTMCCQVADEFPADEIIVVDLRQSNLDKNPKYWIDVGNPHLHDAGHAELAHFLKEALECSVLTKNDERKARSMMPTW